MNTLRGASCFFRFAKGGRVGSGLSQWLGFVPFVVATLLHINLGNGQRGMLRPVRHWTWR